MLVELIPNYLDQVRTCTMYSLLTFGTFHCKDCYSVVSGGVEIAEAVISQRFDYIFFTGGASIGKRVMVKAAENLTPVTLELGGKRYGSDSCNWGETRQLNPTPRLYSRVSAICQSVYSHVLILCIEKLFSNANDLP